MARTVAITGATGFLGRQVTRVFLEAGWQVRILTRQDPVHALWRSGEVEAVFGSLADDMALRRLCRGADRIIHVAGLVKARRDVDFHRVNVGGSVALAHAIRAVAPDTRAILVSSLAAREPQLSPYAASKRDAETEMRTLLGEHLTVVRPTAIYGPGDQETFQFIAAAARGWPLPLFDPRARLTLVHVEDVARDIMAMIDHPAAQPVAICDSRPEGYSWREIMAAAAHAVGIKERLVRVPGLALQVAGLGGGVARRLGGTTILTPGKARELLHLDWTVLPQERGVPDHRPRLTLEEGFADTVSWARKAGWLRPG